jgi:hypothetical protein
MSGKKIILVSIGLVWINTGVQAEEWGRIKCLRECTDRSCSDPVKMETCQNNCAHNPDTLEACQTAKPVQQPPQSGSRKLPTPNLPVKSMTPVVEEAQPVPEETASETQIPEQQSDIPAVVEQAQPEFDKSTAEMQESAGSIRPARPREPAPPKQSTAIYTAAEVNNLLKGLLDDQIKEVTTGCRSAIGKIEGGLKMVSGENTKVEIVNERGKTDTIDLPKTGNGFIEIFKKEQEDAESWVKSFDVSRNLSNNDLKKYGINEINFKEKISLKNLKKIYQKSQEKSLLAAQDCKVKSAQFQIWLEAYLAKKQRNDEAANKKFNFLSWGGAKK